MFDSNFAQDPLPNYTDAYLISLNAPGGGSGQNVVWTSLVNATANGSSVTKTSGCDGCPDAGATSQQQIASGNGFMEFTASEIQKLRWVGLSNGNPGTSEEEIDFAIPIHMGLSSVYESGVWKADISGLAAGDVLRIAVEGGVVKYYRNGGLIYTSEAAPTYPLIVDCALLDAGATVNNAVISSQ